MTKKIPTPIAIGIIIILALAVGAGVWWYGEQKYEVSLIVSPQNINKKECIDSNAQCKGKQNGISCDLGVWCDVNGEICGGQSCTGLGLGECENEKCVIEKDETAEWQTYRNEKYGFEVKYPNNWQIDEDKSFFGLGFRPNNLNIQAIQSGNYNKETDCFFNIVVLSKSLNKILSCKNEVDEIMLGSNRFIKCQFTSIQDSSKTSFSYMTIHPKTSNIIDFPYLNNSSCEEIIKKSFGTLIFD